MTKYSEILSDWLRRLVPNSIRFHQGKINGASCQGFIECCNRASQGEVSFPTKWYPPALLWPAQFRRPSAVESAAKSTIWIEKCLCRWRSKHHPHFWTTPGIKMTQSRLAGLWEYSRNQAMVLQSFVGSPEYPAHPGRHQRYLNPHKAGHGASPNLMSLYLLAKERLGTADLYRWAGILASRAYPVLQNNTLWPWNLQQFMQFPHTAPCIAWGIELFQFG